jgi:hypothetical protein
LLLQPVAIFSKQFMGRPPSGPSFPMTKTVQQFPGAAIEPLVR